MGSSWFARSVAVSDRTCQPSGGIPADRMARMRQQRLGKTRSGEVIASGLHQYLQAFNAENDLLHEAIGRQFKFG